MACPTWANADVHGGLQEKEYYWNNITGWKLKFKKSAIPSCLRILSKGCCLIHIGLIRYHTCYLPRAVAPYHAEMKHWRVMPHRLISFPNTRSRLWFVKSICHLPSLALHSALAPPHPVLHLPGLRFPVLSAGWPVAWPCQSTWCHPSPPFQ